MAWDEAAFLRNTEGSAIRRIGFERWQRNLAVAAGNALHGAKRADKNAPYEIHRGLITMLASSTSALVQEHVQWALTPT
jgi:epoxyqueuosine reductase